ncbi:MAG TPA: alpha/beta hydrolase domain-containing protein, partial [Magnetospirillaceae bacterium]|nr:alpha/beta hydrolase domain-containing protein [Magnetospirillaceae bacterium]
RFDGSFVPFARTKAERKAAKDPRPSLEERYRSRDDYVHKVETAADRQIAAGFLLAEDRARAISEVTGLYDRILAHDPKDQSCEYLFEPQ